MKTTENPATTNNKELMGMDETTKMMNRYIRKAKKKQQLKPTPSSRELALIK
jgi:hypothetical protein